jgi:hypothetical protein
VVERPDQIVGGEEADAVAGLPRGAVELLRDVALSPSGRVGVALSSCGSVAERVRLVAAPGGLRDVELEVLGWRTEPGEVALNFRLIDGSTGTIPARWTDLPRREEPEPALGSLGSPPAWRPFREPLERLQALRPRRRRASGENGGARVATARACDQRADGGRGGGLGEVAAGAPAAGEAPTRAAAGRA